ncbi:GAF domain-containing protein [Mycobacterium sp. PS03-16]|uniref:helix-turn-helix domain-containing protein n=1 Tax=Mycobacterium sp. PS03-16 TaxID=2559611 RepID=UPI00142F6351|nr:GAF domain-containing protein [Mycobacterium sp. PS03-16]
MSVNTPPPLERWLDALADIGAAVGGDEPVADLLDRVARTACTLLDYDFCAVFLPDTDGRSLSIVGSHGLSPDYVAQVNATRPILLDVRGADEAPTSIAFRTGEVVVLSDIELQPGFAWGGVAHEQGYRALISVPLRRAGAVVGAINGYRAGPHRFDAAEISLVTTLASQVAIALGTAQLRAREQDTIRELRRAEEVHALLTATALRGEGVAGVAAALSELLNRAVLIEDVYGERLAATAWDDAVVTDAESAAGHVGIDDDLAAGEVVSGEFATVAGVVLDGDVVARVHVRAPRGSLSGLDVRAVEHAAVVTALELLRSRTAAQVEQRLRGSLVADLLSADGDDLADLLDRARRLGWDLSGPQALLAVRGFGSGSGGPATERLLAATDRLVSRLAPRPLVAVHRGDLVLVSPTGDGAGAARHLAARLVDSLTGAALVERAVAAVAAAGAVADLPATFRTLRGALDLAVPGATSSVIDLQDMAIDHLLLQLDDPERLRAFARAALGPALDYDRQRGTELLRTARALLDQDLDRRRTAALLHLHPNTVQQRIRRLEDLTGLRLTRPRDLLQLTAALTVAQIAGMG